MKKKPVQIVKEIPEFTSMDYNALKEEGIETVQALSGDIWTDYNPHDPGVTIMEQLCFALTDLGYRTNFKIQDLLNARSRKRRQELNNTFFDALDALPTNPISLNDYRILIIDRIQYVRNAWIYPIDDHLQGIQGLYQIFLQVDDTIREDKYKIEAIKSQVLALFNDYRNLSEDIEVIEILDIERIIMEVDIDIASDTTGEEILAKILFKVEEYLNPTIQFYTLEELQKEGYSVDEIFDGPKPEHGFIKREELHPIRREVYISKLIEIITGVEGVRRIEYFEVKKNGIQVEGDVILIEPKKYPLLDMDPIHIRFLPQPGKKVKYPIRFYKGPLKYELDLNTTNQLYSSLFASYKKRYSSKMLYRERDYPSVLKAEEIPRYYSIQNAFPVTYGINRFGLPNNVRPTRERKAMIKQLRGYLSFFEQIIANYLTQLANIKKLFAVDESVKRTYFCQIPLDAPGIGEIMKTRSSEPEKQADEFLEKLEKLVARFDPYADRRNRFLDHLLARFGEQFTTDFLLRGDGNSHTNAPDELINAKIKYLRNWVVLSKNRGRGFNYMKSTLDEWNVSGLEKRICSLLNITQSGNESLVRAFRGEVREEKMPPMEDIFIVMPHDPTEGNLDLDLLADNKYDDSKESSPPEGFTSEDLLEGIKGEEDKKASKETSSEPKQKQTEAEEEKYDYRDCFVFRAHVSQTAEYLDGNLLRDLLSNGILSFNYLVTETEGRDTHSIYYRSTSKQIYKIREVDTKSEAKEQIEHLIAYLYRINRYCEGMHLIEHILLRPQAKDRYGFKLLDDNFSPLLQNYKFGKKDSQEHKAFKISSIGAELNNYDYEKQKNGSYQIVLKDPDKNNEIIAICPVVFADPASAKRHATEIIVEYIKSYVDNRIPLTDQIKLEKEESQFDTVKNTFYSFKISIVLPDWPIRFQNADFRNLLAEVTGANIPAHLGADFYWLNVDEMTEFETTYMAWLDERTKEKPLQPDLDEKAYKVIQALEKYKNKKT